MRCRFHRQNYYYGFILSFFLTFCGAALFAQSPNPAGQATFKAHCVVCHGADGTGNTTMGKQMNVPDLHSADVQNMSTEEMVQVVTAGKDPMPAFQDQLTSGEIAKVVAYVRTLDKKTK